MKAFKNILKCIASLFLVLLVLVSIYTFVVTDIMKKDYSKLWTLFKSMFVLSACTFGGGFVIVSLMKKKRSGCATLCSAGAIPGRT